MNTSCPGADLERIRDMIVLKSEAVPCANEQLTSRFLENPGCTAVGVALTVTSSVDWRDVLNAPCTAERREELTKGKGINGTCDMLAKA